MSLEKFYEQFFESQEITLANTEAERLQLAYRVVRECARQRGVVTPGQTLMAATRAHPSPLTEPFGWFLPPRDRLLHDQLQEVPLPLVPTEATEGRALEFVKVAEHVAIHHLMAFRDSSARRAAFCLFDPHLLTLAWPTPDDVLEYEGLLVGQIYDTLVHQADRTTSGDQEALAELENRGFRPHECDDIMRMARHRAIAATGQDDPEGFRALEVSRMLQLAHRQSANGDYRGAAQTRRDILRIHQSSEASGGGDEDLDSVVEATIRDAPAIKKKLQITKESDA